jgi:hypothetical protein
VSSDRPRPRRPLWQRAVMTTGILVATFVAVGGVLHMPFARGLLMKAGGCPMGAEASPQEIDKAHQGALAKQRGRDMAPARPAFGFALDTTTRAEVIAWAQQARVACQRDRGGILRCNAVPASAVGAPDVEGPMTTLSFGFNAQDRLVDVSSMRMHLTPAAGLASVTDIMANLTRQLGAPHNHLGAFDLEHLSEKSLGGLSNVAYRFHDYAVDVVAMSFDTDGLVLREHYASIADGS